MPATHAFVGNGIMNHNTVNMPEEATVEDVEELHIEAWRLGLKAVALYRDNCKVGAAARPRRRRAADRFAGGVANATPAQVVERIVEHVIVQEPVRQKLPRTRNSKTFSFRVADCHGYVTVGEFEDGRPGEMFLKVAKQGSTLAGIMDAFAISVSHGLQYGVPLEAFVEMFTNMRFEPAGMTDDPDLRIATSLVDYIFRRLAVEYLAYESGSRHGRAHGGGAHAADAAGRGGGGDANEPHLRTSSRWTTRRRRRRSSRRRRTPPLTPGHARMRRSRDGALPRLRRHHAAGRQLPRLPELRRHQRLLVGRSGHIRSTWRAGPPPTSRCFPPSQIGMTWCMWRSRSAPTIRPTVPSKAWL